MTDMKAKAATHRYTIGEIVEVVISGTNTFTGIVASIYPVVGLYWITGIGQAKNIMVFTGPEYMRKIKQGVMSNAVAFDVALVHGDLQPFANTFVAFADGCLVKDVSGVQSADILHDLMDSLHPNIKTYYCKFVGKERIPVLASPQYCS
jgi:hypothetical protein